MKPLEASTGEKAFQFDLPSNFRDIGKLTLFPLPLGPLSPSYSSVLPYPLGVSGSLLGVYLGLIPLPGNMGVYGFLAPGPSENRKTVWV
jgi:hypothetical protein